MKKKEGLKHKSKSIIPIITQENLEINDENNKENIPYYNPIIFPKLKKSHTSKSNPKSNSNKLKNILTEIQSPQLRKHKFNLEQQENIILNNSTSILDEDFNNLTLNLLPKSQPKKQFKNFSDIENERLIINFGNQALLNFKEREKKEIYPDLHERYKVLSATRTRMVDWMFEIFNAYECAIETFFLSVYIFDKYLCKTKLEIRNSDIHLLGITCIFLASKYEDVCPLNMEKILVICSQKFET